MSKESLGNCVICGKDACVVYPLLPNEPAFCHKHHNPKDAEPFGCDFTGPDDFDIPDPWPDSWEAERDTPPPFTATRATFVWKDINGNKHKLADIDDGYLQNIISFLRRKLKSLDVYSAAYWAEVIAFLTKEQGIRSKQGGME